jgi:hypothetical protein
LGTTFKQETGMEYLYSIVVIVVSTVIVWGIKPYIDSLLKPKKQRTLKEIADVIANIRRLK